MASLSLERNQAYRIHWRFTVRAGPDDGKRISGSLQLGACTRQAAKRKLRDINDWQHAVQTGRHLPARGFDEGVNVHDEQDVLFHMGANVDWRRDVMIVDGPCDILDHATPYYGTGAKIGIDATRKIEGEGTVREWPEELEMSDAIKQQVERRWKEYGL